MKNVHFALPEIYDDSLSYYDVLRKLIKSMNTVIENYNTIPDQIDEAVKNLDASQLFSAVLNQFINTIATDNTKSANAVKLYKKHDLLYATFDDTVNLYESLIDFTTGTETELIVGTNIREVNISELFIELRKLIDDEAKAINTEKSAREQADTTLQRNINEETTARRQGDITLQNNIDAERTRATGKETELKNDIADTKTSVLNEIKAWVNETQHPIGSIYITTTNVSPSTIFGGTWEQLKDRFLLACGDKYNPGTTGGEEEHTLSIDEMPSHSHDTANPNIIANDNGENPITFKNGTDARVSQNTRATVNVGGNLPHNNMPPYITVYVWKRIR